jgi:D-alanyl-D-alanine carboxypeptidase
VAAHYPPMQPHIESGLRFVDSWLAYQTAQSPVPGLQVAITQGGETLFSKAYGVTDMLTKQPLTPSHLFRVASHAKTVTALAAMQCIEEGRVDLNAPTSRYVPWLDHHPNEGAQYATVQELLMHRTGLPPNGRDADWAQSRAPYPDRDGLYDLVLNTRAKRIDRTLQYSNLGYALLGQVLEVATEQPYGDLVAKRIFEPLDSADTMRADYVPALAPRMASGHMFKQAGKPRRMYAQHQVTNALAPAMGLCANAEALCRLMTSAFAHTAIIGAQSQHLMRTLATPMPSSGSYGLGVKMYPKPSELIGHDGAFAGFSTSTYANLADRLVVSVLANSNDIVAREAVMGIHGIFNYLRQCGTEQDVPMPTLQRYEVPEPFTLYTSARKVVAIGNCLVDMAMGWDPAASARKLIQIGRDRWRVTTALGMSDVQGEVEFLPAADGQIGAIRCPEGLLWVREPYFREFLGDTIVEIAE